MSLAVGCVCMYVYIVLMDYILTLYVIFCIFFHYNRYCQYNPINISKVLYGLDNRYSVFASLLLQEQV